MKCVSTCARDAADDDDDDDTPRDLSATYSFNIVRTRDCDTSYISSGNAAMTANDAAPPRFFLSITASGSAICFILSWLRFPMMSIFFIIQYNKKRLNIRPGSRATATATATASQHQFR